MSDEGSYVCRLPNGSETRTILEVTTGCHNNLKVSSKWLNQSSLQLSCQHCTSGTAADSFNWLLNSKQLGRRPWAHKSHLGSNVTLNPIRPAIWGRWECHSKSNLTWISEICLKKHMMKDAASHRWFPASTPWTPAAAPKKPDVTGTEVWIWTTLLAGLGLVPVLGIAVCFWARESAGRRNKRRKKAIDHASLRNPAEALLLQNKEVPEQRSLDEATASLHYAQLQLPPGKSSSIPPQDSPTIYAAVI
ncbi:uncharacterized protein LOC143834399 [Paroedura picta]|uniref:uncharacterized protein LOC143834399 n=1 Tax=Paroedura picta TaxID=143630 RepID=UPI0040560F6D